MNEFISASIQTLPRPNNTPNINNIAIVSNETWTSTDPYLSVISLDDVKPFFAESTKTYKMVQSILNQTPNYRTSTNAVLYIIPFDGVNAVAGSFTTKNIFSNLTAIKAVSNGSITITINGTDYDLSGLSFTNISSEPLQAGKDIANVIIVGLNKLSPLNISKITSSVAFTGGNDLKITFQSTSFGLGKDIAFSTLAGGTDLTGSTLLDTPNGTSVAGANSSGTTITQALNNFEASLTDTNRIYFNGFISTQNIEGVYTSGILKTIADYCVAKERIFINVLSSADDIAEYTKIVEAQSSFFRAVKINIEQIDTFKSAILGRLFANNLQPGQAFTLNKKRLVGITTDTSNTNALIVALKNAGIDYVVFNSGFVEYVSNGANQFIDAVYENIILESQLLQVQNVLNTNTKIPQTTAGRNQIRGAITTELLVLKANGIISTDLDWQGEVPQEIQILNLTTDFTGKVRSDGFYILMQDIQEQPAQQRANREIQANVYVQKAGAIHKISLNVLVSN